MDKRQQCCFWADVKERVVWGGGRSDRGLCVHVFVCVGGWDRGGGSGLRPGGGNRVSAALVYCEPDGKPTVQAEPCRSARGFYGTPRTRDLASFRLHSRMPLKWEQKGQTPPPGELQGARCIIELRGCVTAQNLSKQFSVCGCCLRRRSLLWPKMRTSERVNVSANSMCSRQTDVFSLCLRLLT